MYEEDQNSFERQPRSNLVIFVQIFFSAILTFNVLVAFIHFCLFFELMDSYPPYLAMYFASETGQLSRRKLLYETLVSIFLLFSYFSIKRKLKSDYFKIRYSVNQHFTEIDKSTYSKIFYQLYSRQRNKLVLDFTLHITAILLSFFLIIFYDGFADQLGKIMLILFIIQSILTYIENPEIEEKIQQFEGIVQNAKSKMNVSHDAFSKIS